MLEPLDRCRRDSTLFQFTRKRLRDFIDPNHLLIQIDEQLDFAELVAPLDGRYVNGAATRFLNPRLLLSSSRSIYRIRNRFRIVNSKKNKRITPTTV